MVAPAQPKRPAFDKQQPNVVSSIIEKGGIISEKYSVVKLVSGERKLKFFANDEGAKGYSKYAKYNIQGKNPLDSQKGKILAFKLELFGPEFKPLDLSAGATQFAVYEDAYQLINQLAFEFRFNKEIVREPIAKSFIEPLPKLIFPKRFGTGIGNGDVSVFALPSENNNLENERGILRLPLNINASDALEVTADHPDGIGEALVDHLLVLNALTVEFKTEK
ncbi:hypothetical protein [Leptospira bouyouniensis]|uniref:Uncharacterized protein n=1 Tax=Leptospira bouyouniensis TaxID=2484911 RepID=A0ABY2L9A1_9LEPT|nr:hypothetical protein [Leptospira bouyouniensis]TGK53228.1 hypothetical protein EHQ10_05665 [Leptospira bouyouniensis]